MPQLLKIDGKLLDVDESLRELDRADYEESLAAFLKAGWKYINSQPFKDGWVIDALCEHLEAVCDGEIKRLLINIPPRCSKSSICSVAFPAWVWAQRHSSPTSGPGVPILSGSYAHNLAARDSRKARQLIQSPWYQGLWGGRFQLLGDQNAKTRYGNDKGGERLITSPTGATTGEGGNIIIIDDANNAKEVLSEAVIETTNEDWWDGAMSTRLNDAETGAYIVIQQRLGEQDLTGHILESEPGVWTHLCLPMFYEPERSFSTVIGWEDPRTEEGELLWPERFSEETARGLEKRLGKWKAAGQLQQRPEPKGGGIIQREWWQTWAEERYPAFSYIIASLDTAYTEKTENDPSAMTIWGIFSEDTIAQAAKAGNTQTVRTYAPMTPRVMLMHAWADRLPIHELVQKAAKTCKDMKVDKLLVESKASGISVAQELRRLYNHEPWAVQLIDPKRLDKVARLHSVAPMWEAGLIWAPDRTWSDMVITEVAGFPKGAHDDLTDTASMAVRHLRDLGLLQLAPEIQAEIAEEMQHRGRPPEKLYPG